MYCEVEAALDVTCVYVNRFGDYGMGRSCEGWGTDCYYVDPVPLLCPTEYHDHVATRTFGQVDGAWCCAVLGCFRIWNDFVKLAVGLRLGAHFGYLFEL